MFLSENGPILVGISYHVLFHDYINITICMALLLCEEIYDMVVKRKMLTNDAFFGVIDPLKLI